MDDWTNYQQLADSGASPHEIYLRVRDDGINQIDAIRLLRQLFNLGLENAKEVTHVASSIARNRTENSQEPLGPFLESMFAIEADKARYRQRYIDLFTAALNGQLSPLDFDAALHDLWQVTQSHPNDVFHIAFSEEKEIIGDVLETEDLQRSVRRARKRLERIIW